jgi:hypothetical protein
MRQHRRTRPYGRTTLIAVLFAALALAGCAQSGGPGAGSGVDAGDGASEPGVAATDPNPNPDDTAGSGTGSGTSNTTTGSGTATAGGEYRVTYNWAVPSKLVTVPHPLKLPLTTPLGTPLPYLTGVFVGDHPEGNPAYVRMSFYFRGAFPEYNFNYASEIRSDGEGAKLPLAGNSFLRLQFWPAQAHDNNGKSTITAKPDTRIGLGNLVSYVFAGDYEGYVTYGLGIGVAPGSDQVLPIRAGELKKPDGKGGYIYVVHFDVQKG